MAGKRGTAPFTALWASDGSFGKDVVKPGSSSRNGLFVKTYTDEVIDPVPRAVDGYITVPDTPGLRVDIIEEAVEKFPGMVNVSVPVTPDSGAYEEGSFEEHVYVRSRFHRQKVFRTK